MPLLAFCPYNIQQIKNIVKHLTKYFLFVIIPRMIIKRVDGYYVVSEKGRNLGGPYKTRKRARLRLRQVEMFKHMHQQKKF